MPNLPARLEFLLGSGANSREMTLAAGIEHFRGFAVRIVTLNGQARATPPGRLNVIGLQGAAAELMVEKKPETSKH
jgi:hypothetical protein